MTTSFPEGSSEQVIARYFELTREADELQRRYELKEKEELQALNDAEREIDAEIKDDRENLVKGLPVGTPIPEVFDKFLAEKRDLRMQKLRQEYEAKKNETKKLYDADKLKHAEKWKSLLLPTQPNTASSVRNLDLTVPEPRPSRTSESVMPPSAPPHAHVHPHPHAHAQAHPHPHAYPIRPVDVGVPRQHREGPPVHVGAAQPPHPYLGIVGPQILPRPPVVLSQSTAVQARIPPNTVHTHHAISHPRPPEPQHVAYQPQPPPPPHRLPDQPMIAKPRTALPETPREQEGRPEITRVPPQGLNLPRILPQGEQHQTRPENEHFKRKAENHLTPAQTEKRTKVQETKSNVSASAEAPRIPRGQKTIAFDEVYQNGNPQFKHVIVEYPTNSRKYYILRCDEHGVHFNQNPLAGAAKHLHSAQHGNMSKERAQAVELLGYNIFDCDEAKMRQNNAMVEDAFQKGYKPLNLNQLTKAGRASLNLPGDSSPSGTPSRAQTAISTNRASNRDGSQTFSQERTPASTVNVQRTFAGITNPRPGELYLGYWPTEKRNYAVMMLPLGDLKVAGMQGRLEDTGLLEPSKVPYCYVYNNATKTWGWAPGYEDGGPYVSKREFPVLYIDGRSSVGWLRAKDLSPFHFDNPLWRDIPYFKEARRYYAIVKGYPGYEEMMEMTAAKDGRAYGRNLSAGATATRSPPATSQPPTTLPSQSDLTDKSRLNADTQRPAASMASPAVEVEMADASPVSDRDSYQDSINKGLDSDNDAEMANTESRRTSVSNRGDNQPEQGAPEQVLKQPFAQPIPPAVFPPRQVDLARPYVDRPPPNYEMTPTAFHPPAGPAQPQDPTPKVNGSSELAQMIASRALHLQSPERDQPATVGLPRPEELARGGGARSEPVSRTDPTPSNGHGYRRVEKIHAKSSNPYRTSPNQSPSMPTTMLPDARAENGSSQSSVSRNSSPASLHNILQNPSPQPQAVMARPGPLSQNGPASLPLHQARHSPMAPRPLPTDQTLIRTTSPPMRSPSVLASFAQPTRLPPSPPHTNGLGIQQHSRSPVMEHQGQARIANSPVASAASHPPTRTPTPVILKSHREIDDRWRAVRSETSSQAEASSVTAPVPVSSLYHDQRQPVADPISASHLSAGSSHEPALNTAVTSVSEARSDSPVQVKESRVSPAPLVKTELGAQSEYFSLAGVTCNKEVLFDHSKTGGQLLRLAVDAQAKTVSAVPEAGIELVVDPNMVKEAVFQASNVSPTAETVRLQMVDGKEVELVFELSEMNSGQVLARRFCRWMKGINERIEYMQNASRATPSTPSVITIE
ncbi:hypothetical protein V8F20_003883 [Naviculisporaceae sp. PSN 640]